MQLSPKTLTILKNFAAINDRILIEPGTELTISKTAVFGRATVAERFPVQIGIYDLTNFLKVIGLFKAADCDFQDNFVRICEGNGDGEVRYLYATPECVRAKVPRKLANPPTDAIQFDLPEDKWAALQKAASVLAKPEVRISSDGRAVSITTYNHKHPDGNEFSTALTGHAHGHSCNAIFQLDNFKLLQGCYHATLTPSYAVFKNVAGYELTYWIGCDPESTFD